MTPLKQYLPKSVSPAFLCFSWSSISVICGSWVVSIQEAFENPKRPSKSSFWCNSTRVFLFKLKFRLPADPDKAGWEGDPKGGTVTPSSPQQDKGLEEMAEQVRGCPAWQASNRMTVVSGQVGALKQNHDQSQTVWKYMWNYQANLDWQLLGSSYGITLGYGSETNYVVLPGTRVQVGFSCRSNYQALFLLKWRLVPRWGGFVFWTSPETIDNTLLPFLLVHLLFVYFALFL